MDYSDLPNLVHVLAKNVINDAKTSLNPFNCYTLNSGLPGIRVTTRGLLCIRIFIKKDDLPLQYKNKKSANSWDFIEFALPARAYLYWLKNKVQLTHQKGKDRKILIPFICKNRDCINPDHQRIMPYKSNLIDIICGEKIPIQGINKRKRVTKITVETKSITYPNPIYGDRPNQDLRCDPGSITIDL